MSSKPDFVIRFVSAANTRKEQMQNAVKGVQAAKVPTERVKEEAILEMTSKDANLYVCDPFEGEAFDHLLKLGCRIVGAQCVLSCLELDISLPRVNHPVHNLSLFGAVITCSSIAKQQRELVHKKIHWMGGIVSKDLTECITHLVAGEVGSKKYHVAADLKKPILLPTWVDACWEEGQTKHFKGTNMEVVSLYKCPIFKGCNICLTGFHMDEKKKIEEAVMENGGIYSKELKFQESTHLIVGSAKGSKYEYAKKWKLHCVSLRWLTDGIEKGYSCNEALYLPDGPEAECHTSTPVKDKRTSAFKGADVSTISNISSYSSINETAMTTFNLTEVKGQMVPDAPVSLESGLRALEELKLDKTHETPFLDGCKIYFSDFTGDLVEKVRRVINAGGGTRLSQLNEAVTHILVADRVTQNVRNFHLKAQEVHILNSMWLVQSYHAGQRQPEKKYLLPEFAKEQTPVKNEEITKPKRQSKDSSKIEDQQPDMLFNQYRQAQGDDDEEIKFPMPSENKSIDEDETVMEMPGMDGTFADKIFTILGFSPKEMERIQNQIMDAKGKILTETSRAIPDFAVVPLEGWEVKRTVGEVVTVCWVDMCREAEQFLPIAGNILFKPLAVSNAREPLSDCVITFSQYSGVEKQYLNLLAESLGATCQDYFQRKAKKGSKANTHLVLQSPEGSKYEASKKWGIPAVTTDWIFKCAKSGQKLPEGAFLIDGTLTTDDDKSTDQKEADEPSQEFPVADGNLTKHPVAMDVDVTPTHSKNPGNADAFKTPNIGTLNLYSAKRPCSDSVEKSAKKLRRVDFGRVETPMEGTPSTPGRFLRASQDFIPKLGIDTPASAKVNRRKSSLPYEVCLYENLVTAVEATGGERMEMKDSEDEEDRKELNDKENVDKVRILRSAIVYVAEKLSHRRSDLHKLVKSLGGDVRWSLDANCTHLIFQGKPNDTDKEFRKARKGSVHTVSPEWLLACKEAKRRMDEKLYPHTVNPNMSLSLSQVQTDDIRRSRKASAPLGATMRNPSPKVEDASEVFEDPDLSMEEAEMMIAQAEAIEEKENANNSDEQREEFQRQFAQIMSTSGNQGSGKTRSRRQTTSTDGGSRDGNSSLSTENRRTSRRMTRSRRDSKVIKTEVESKDKAVEHDSDPSCVITWDDATSRVCRENALARLRGEGLKEESVEDEDQQKAEVKEFTELGNFHASNEMEKSPSIVKTPPPIRLPHAKPAVAPERTEEERMESMQAPNKKVFLFTGLTEQERIDYGALIEQLGGEVADKTYYDNLCTHMIVGNPSKNEKYLAAVAAGKWILHRSYMVECQKAGKFIEEAPHELNASMFTEKNPRASVLCHAPKRWREQLQDEVAEHHGAFDGWKVLMVVEEAKERGLKRILEAGCGVVLATRVPFPASRSEATHLFVSTSKMKGLEEVVDYVELVSNGTLCLKPEYIAEFLIKSPSPDPSLFLLTEVRSILQRIADETTQSAVATRSGSMQRRKTRDSAQSDSKNSRH